MDKIEKLGIGHRSVGKLCPCLLIAEVGQNHDGSLGQAHAYIDAVAQAGFDAIKFQTHIAQAESTYDEPFRVVFSKQDKTRYDYWKRMEFTFEQWQGLSQHAAEKRLIFLSSAFSVEAVELLQKLDMPAWKVGSGEYKSQDLIDAMIKTKKPILLSTGMSKISEINEMLNYLSSNQNEYALFQCTSMYPTPFEAIGLNLLKEFKETFKCPVGLSDHSGKTHAAIAAIAMGADMYECHVTFDKRMFGPDVIASLTIEELKAIADFRNELNLMLTNPVDKDDMADTLSSMRDLFTKSIAPACELKAGTIIQKSLFWVFRRISG